MTLRVPGARVCYEAKKKKYNCFFKVTLNSFKSSLYCLSLQDDCLTEAAKKYYILPTSLPLPLVGLARFAR
jgi:hypothetical protein